MPAFGFGAGSECGWLSEVDVAIRILATGDAAVAATQVAQRRLTARDSHSFEVSASGRLERYCGSGSLLAKCCKVEDTRRGVRAASRVRPTVAGADSCDTHIARVSSLAVSLASQIVFTSA